ncbi:MAG: acyl-CoA dehydrogenase family protein, partial [Candidatus Rokuibacteriota bacterium]
MTFGIAMEEIARGDFSCTYGVQLATLAGETVIALALTEPGAGSDAASLECRAEPAGDDYVITGEKSGISLG